MPRDQAARLVLQAQALSDGGELFILEMGEPVRIVDLAHTDYRLIDTACERVLHVNAMPLITADFEDRIAELVEHARCARCRDTVAMLGVLVPDYAPYATGAVCDDEAGAVPRTAGV